MLGRERSFLGGKVRNHRTTNSTYLWGEGCFCVMMMLCCGGADVRQPESEIRNHTMLKIWSTIRTAIRLIRKAHKSGQISDFSYNALVPSIANLTRLGCLADLLEWPLALLTLQLA